MNLLNSLKHLIGVTSSLLPLVGSAATPTMHAETCAPPMVRFNGDIQYDFRITEYKDWQLNIINSAQISYMGAAIPAVIRTQLPNDEEIRVMGAKFGFLVDENWTVKIYSNGGCIMFEAFIEKGS
jgi:hypothetical protein